MNTKWTYVNNQFVKEEEAVLHISDLAIQREYGIFDFLKVVNQVPLYVEDHLERFYNSAQKMRLPINLSGQELKSVILKLMRENNLPHSGIRITLTGGYSEDGYTLSRPNLIITQQPLLLPDKFPDPIKLLTYDYQRELPEIKSINYTMGIWLQSRIQESNAADVLYCKNGLVSECPRSNFFIITTSNKLVTPAEGILKGITRKRILEIAPSHFEVEERPISVSELQQIQAAFISSTTKRIIPVSQIDDWPIHPENPGSRTEQLYALLLTAENEYVQQHPA